MRNSIVTIILAATLACLIPSCDIKKEESGSTHGAAQIAVDESFKMIIDQEVQVFEFTYPNASILPHYVSEAEAIDSLISSDMKLIIIPHELSEKQVEYIRQTKGTCKTQRIAVDAIALIVNPANALDSISVEQLADILSGRKALWNQIGGQSSDSVNVIFDYASSSTAKYMRDTLLAGGKFLSERVFAQNSVPEVIAGVENSTTAIGVVSATWLRADMAGSAGKKGNVKVLKVYHDGDARAFKPYQEYIYTAEYPLYRSVYAIAATSGSNVAHGFYSFLTGPVGQKLILQTGILPSVIHPRAVELTTHPAE